MSYKQKILVIDDEPQLRKLLKIALESHDYHVIDASNGKEGIREAAMNQPNLIILDLGLPDLSGFEVFKEIRTFSQTPIIILSVRDSEEEKVALLDAGCNDYVTKPFGMNELLARIRNAIRLNEKSDEIVSFSSGKLTVDLIKRLVTKDNKIIKLTATEYSILLLFIQNAGKVLTHTMILKAIWGSAFTEEAQYLRVFIGQLRKKIESDPARPSIITTEPGIGYRLNIIE